jgi:hypothetical protein
MHPLLAGCQGILSPVGGTKGKGQQFFNANNPPILVGFIQAFCWGFLP